MSLAGYGRISLWGYVTMLFVHTALGAGFMIAEQSAPASGRALAGVTAETDDPGSVFFNASGIAFHEKCSVAVGFHVIDPTMDFKNTGGPLLGGGEGLDAGVTSYVPNFYAVCARCERVRFGLGVTAPYGLSVEYNDAWVGRFHALDTFLMTVDINPVVAVKLTDWLAIGGGVSAQYASARMSRAIGATEKRSIEGESWGYGFNLGITCTYNPGGSVGLHYRSGIRHVLDGDAKFDGALVPFGGGVMPLPDVGGEVELQLPETVSLGWQQRIGEKAAVMADASWIGWSSFEELRVEYDTLLPDSVTEEDWEDTWRLALGGEVDINDALTFRAGVAYDQTPVPNERRRTPRIPDTNRTWLSTGLGVRPCQRCSLDFSYTHIFFENADMSHDVALPGVGVLTLQGEYEGSVDIVSLQVRVSI